jgi:hypothetical protein
MSTTAERKAADQTLVGFWHSTGSLPQVHQQVPRHAAPSTPRPGARSRPGHGHGGCRPRSRRTHTGGAGSPRSRHERNRRPAWSRPASVGIAAMSYACAAARAVSAAVSGSAAPWMPRLGSPGRAARPGSACSPSQGSLARSARPAPRPGRRQAGVLPGEGRSSASEPAAGASAAACPASRAAPHAAARGVAVPGRRAPRSAQSSFGLGFCRRSTATSWRSTSSSASFDAAERASSASHPARRTNIR